MKILLSYTSIPQTTAFYIEKEMRKISDIITYGPTISKELLKYWNLLAVEERVKNHQIPYTDGDIKNVLEQLPSGWHPDAFLFIDTTNFYDLIHLNMLKCIKACYMIDSHINFELHFKLAKNFDVVFTAHKPAVEMYKEKGLENVFWIPPACDPEIHGKKTVEKLYDIGFVGTLNAKLNAERVYLFNELKQRFHTYYERCFLERMAEVFSQSKIVFNKSVLNGLNMRVFEVLASGSMLLTDEAKESGLTELFQDRKHMVIYRNENELYRFAYHYLKNEEERGKIAKEGMEKVLKEHTYGNRAKEMIRIISLFKKLRELESKPT